VKPGYAALIAAGIQSWTELPFAECFTMTLQDGTVLRYTNLDVPVWLNGNYFAANAVRIQGLKFKQTTGVDIDEQEIDLIYGSTDTIKGIPWAQAIRQHVLDGCYIQRERAFFNPATAWPPNPMKGAVATGGVTLFVGRVADITGLGRTTAQINLKSDLVLLDIDFPRNLWQPSCLHTLYDSGCGLNKGNYQTLATAGAGSTVSQIVVSLAGTGAVATANMSGAGGAAIGRVIVTSGGSNNLFYSVPTVTVSDPTGSGAVLRALLSANYGNRSNAYGVATYVLYAIQVVSPGAGYTNPTITISPGVSGTATAEAVLLGGSQSVNSVSVSAGGSGYSGATQVVFSGGGGTGAAGVPVISGGAVTGVTMTNHGTGYSSAPTVAIVDAAFTNFAQGMLMFQGGQNAGTLVQIGSASGSTVNLVAPLNYAPAVGDAFLIWPGCDHSLGAGGCAKFNNQANFRGFPFVPAPNYAY
jgi:hypothetical protein